MSAHADVVRKFGGGKYVYWWSKFGQNIAHRRTKIIWPGLLTRAFAVVYLYRISTHSIRKGAAVIASTSSTAAPPISSLMRRGDWSMGRTMDRYVRWASAGDQYLGRTVALLNPSSVEFQVLPPHFRDNSPADVLDNAVMQVFGSVAIENETFKPVLLRLLASLVFHRDFLVGILDANHTVFTSVFVYREPALYDKLRPYVVQDHDSLQPTGIPPHVDNIASLQKIINLQTTLIGRFEELHGNISETIQKAIESSAVASGTVTAAALESTLTRFSAQNSDHIMIQIKELLQKQSQCANVDEGSSDASCNCAHMDQQVPVGFDFNVGTTDRYCTLC